MNNQLTDLGGYFLTNTPSKQGQSSQKYSLQDLIRVRDTLQQACKSRAPRRGQSEESVVIQELANSDSQIKEDYMDCQMLSHQC